MTRHLISSPEAMQAFGASLAKTHPIILLTGDLGAGKTTFAKGFAQALGINPSQVQSPTYTYLNSYDNLLLHIDMYRLEDFHQVVEKGILDQMNAYDYVLIERPKRIEQLPFTTYIHLTIKKTGPQEREITLSPITTPQQ